SVPERVRTDPSVARNHHILSRAFGDESCAFNPTPARGGEATELRRVSIVAASRKRRRPSAIHLPRFPPSLTLHAFQGAGGFQTWEYEAFPQLLPPAARQR